MAMGGKDQEERARKRPVQPGESAWTETIPRVIIFESASWKSALLVERSSSSLEGE
jgi:hypothetical protein